MIGSANKINKLEDYTRYFGELIKFDVSIVDENGNPIDLTTVTVKFKLCDLNNHEIVFIDKDCDNKGGNISQAVINTIDYENANIVPTKYTYEIDVIYNTGDMNVGKGTLTFL